MKYGWVWKIPVQGRYGCGYVFDSDYINREEALKEVEEYLGHPVESPKSFNFDAGVFESMEYPWFQPRWVSGGNFHDFCAEDVGFCWTAQELGHEIWVDPAIKVLHEKTVLL